MISSNEFISWKRGKTWDLGQGDWSQETEGAQHLSWKKTWVWISALPVTSDFGQSHLTSTHSFLKWKSWLLKPCKELNEIIDVKIPSTTTQIRSIARKCYSSLQTQDSGNLAHFPLSGYCVDAFYALGCVVGTGESGGMAPAWGRCMVQLGRRVIKRWLSVQPVDQYHLNGAGNKCFKKTEEGDRPCGLREVGMELSMKGKGPFFLCRS